MVTGSWLRFWHRLHFSLLLLFNSIIVATQDSRENRERQRLLKYIRRLDSGGSGASAAGGIATARKAVEGFFSRLLKGRASESWLASQLELSDVPLKASEFAAINGANARRGGYWRGCSEATRFEFSQHSHLELCRLSSTCG